MFEKIFKRLYINFEKCWTCSEEHSEKLKRNVGEIFKIILKITLIFFTVGKR